MCLFMMINSDNVVDAGRVFAVPMLPIKGEKCIPGPKTIYNVGFGLF